MTSFLAETSGGRRSSSRESRGRSSRLRASSSCATKEIHTAQQVMQVLLRFCSNTTLTFFLRAMPPSVTLPAAERHDELIDAALYKLVGGARVGAAGKRWERARRQARLPVKMGGMGLTSAVGIREPAWIGT